MIDLDCLNWVKNCWSCYRFKDVLVFGYSFAENVNLLAFWFLKAWFAWLPLRLSSILFQKYVSTVLGLFCRHTLWWMWIMSFLIYTYLAVIFLLVCLVCISKCKYKYSVCLLPPILRLSNTRIKLLCAMTLFIHIIIMLPVLLMWFWNWYFLLIKILLVYQMSFLFLFSIFEYLCCILIT